MNEDVDRLIRDKEITRLTGLSRSTIWKMSQAGQFPARVKISTRRCAWKLSEVSDWINSRESVIDGS